MSLYDSIARLYDPWSVSVTEDVGFYVDLALRAGGDDFEATVFDVDPETPIGSWKEAWESVKRKTKVEVRFHDLRHTCVTRMLEGAVPLSVVASITRARNASDRRSASMRLSPVLLTLTMASSRSMERPVSVISTTR